MAKYIAAIVQERNGTCTVLKCYGKDDQEKQHRYGQIAERIYVKNYGAALVKAAEIEGNL